MCGIFGYIGTRADAAQLVLAGLKKLEYRGYDSWGIAAKYTTGAATEVRLEKHVGKIGRAETTLPGSSLAIGHTRWATHGGVTDANAHPHLDCGHRFAVIHNGIIENHSQLRRELVSRGHRFLSETDTEVVVHLLEETLAEGPATEERLATGLMEVFRRLDGLNALAVMDSQANGIATIKNGSPLVVGSAEDGHYLASDPSALLSHTRQVTYLEDGQAALLSSRGIDVFDAATGEVVQPRVWDIAWEDESVELLGHPDYMSKEIHEQPAVLRRVLSESREDAARLAELVKAADAIHFVGCGSAGHAGKVAEYLFARIAGRQVSFSVGSEFGYLETFLDQHSLVVGLSQSGETIDLLESMKAAKKRGATLAALVNVEGSSLYRLVDHPILLHAGPERCVLATKSFTAKLAVALLAAYAAAGALDEGCRVIEQAADEIQRLLTDDRAQLIRDVAQKIVGREHLYVIGRGPSYPMALEAALKVKEVSYLHAEGFAAGELKHGVIALIEEGSPCLVLAPSDETYAAVVSGAQEIKARGGYIIGVSPHAEDVWDVHIPVADVGEGAALVYAVPPQMLAYNLALLRGLDPDKPRNLAKSVTVK